MNFTIGLLLWFILLVLCWPLAVLLVLFYPILWLLSIPFRIVGGALRGLVALISALFLLPSRNARLSCAMSHDSALVGSDDG